MKTETHINWFDFSRGTILHKVAIGRNLENYRFPLHNHTGQWEVLCCLKGRFSHFLNGETSIIHEGELVLIRAQDTHSIRGSDFSFANIPFEEELLSRVFAAIGVKDWEELFRSQFPVISLDAHQRQSFERDMEVLFQGDSVGIRLRLLGFLSWLFSECIIPNSPELSGLLDIYPPRNRSAPVGEDWIEDLLSWIDGLSPAIPTVKEVVAHSGYSQEHLSRRFSAYMKKMNSAGTLSEYLKNKRLKQAAKLLSDTNLRVSIIAQNTGYSSNSLFHRDFKGEYHCTPLDYRRRNGMF